MEKHILEELSIGDTIIFNNDAERAYQVKHIGERFAFACTHDGCKYTIVDKEEKCLASTTMLFEQFGNFNKAGHAQKLEELLLNGERELSRKYRDSFADFTQYKGIVKKREELQ